MFSPVICVTNRKKIIFTRAYSNASRRWYEEWENFIRTVYIPQTNAWKIYGLCFNSNSLNY